LTSRTGSCLEFSGGFTDRIVGGNNNIRLIAPTAFPQSTGLLEDITIRLEAFVRTQRRILAWGRSGQASEDFQPV